MVQVLPYVPTFGEKLADALGNATTTISQGFQQQRQNQRDDMSLKIMNDPTKSPMEKVTAFMGLSEDKKKHVAPVYAAAIAPEAQAQAENRQLEAFKNQAAGGQQQPMQQPQGMPPQQPQGMPQAQMGLSGQQVQQPNQMMAPPQQTQAQQQVDPNNVETWPDELVQQMAATKGPAGELGKQEYQRRQKLKEEDRRLQADIAKEDRALLNKPTEKFFDKVEEERGKIESEDFATDLILSGIYSGEVDPWSKAHWGEIAKSFGAPDSITNALFQTPGSKEFNTGIKTFLGSILKDTFRGNTTEREIKTAENLMAQVGVSRDGNLAAAYAMKSATEFKRERIRLTDELREQGVSPSKIPAAVDKMLQPYQKALKEEYFEFLDHLKEKKK